MEFNSFQNDTATLNQFMLDDNGNMGTIKSISIRCDVQFEVRRITNNQGEQVTTTAKVFATPTPQLDKVNTYGSWTLLYKGETYTVERFMRVRYPASSAISHYEIYLK